MKTVKNSLPVVVARRIFSRYFSDKVGQSAAELAYYLMFSLFPLLIFLNAALSTLNFSPEHLLEKLNIVLPEEIVSLFTEYMDYIGNLKSDVLLYAGLILTVFMLFRAVNSLTGSVMTVYRIQRHGILHYFGVLMFCLLLMVAVFVFLLVMILSGNLLSGLGRYLYIPELFLQLWDMLRLFLVPLCMLLMLWAFYHMVGRGQYHLRQSLPGAIFALVLWIAMTMAFSYYVANMGGYSLLYGSLSTIMVLMLWLWLTGVVLIMGGVFNHVLVEERKLRCTDEGNGKNKPL